MFQRLLTLVDGSPFGARALPYTAWLAAAAHGEILLLRATTADEQREDVEWELAREVGRLRRSGLAARALVNGDEARRTADVLLAVQQAQQASLIVLATHGGRGPERALWGSTADDVLRRAPVPVLLVPKRAQPAWPRRRPLRVLLSLDSSASTQPALLLVQCLNAVAPIQLLLAAGIDPGDQPAPTTRASAATSPPISDRLEPYRDGIACRVRAAGIETFVQVRLDDAAPHLADVARDAHSDLIVMAMAGRHGAMHVLFGGDVRDVPCRLPIPLLFARPTDPVPP